MENESQQSKPKSDNTKSPKFSKIVAFLAVLVIFILVGVIVWLVYFNKTDAAVIEETPDGRGTLLTPENMDEVLGEKVQSGYFETAMSNSWTFEGTNSTGDVYVANSVTNANRIYFDLIINESGETVYSSPYIPIGAELKEFELEKELPDGDYGATVKYHLVDDDGKDISTVQVAVTIHVYN